MSLFQYMCYVFLYHSSNSEDVKVPSPPRNVQASDITEDYVVLSWDEPDPRGKEPIKYYVEKVFIN